MTHAFEPRHAVIAGSLVVGGFLVGWLLARLVARRLRSDVTISRWGASDVMAGAVRGVLVVWTTALGVYVAILVLPLTQSASSRLLRLLAVVLVVSGTLVFARLAANLMRLYSLRRGGVMLSSTIFVTLTRLTIVAIGILFLLQMLGVSITPLLTALGVGGLAVALALQDTLANLFAGFHILASRKLNPGDYVRLDTGEEGYVLDINWRNTSIRQLPNNVILVPNAKLASAIVTNFYQPEREMSVPIDVGVSYGSDLDHVERVAVEVAREILVEIEGGVEAFEPFVRYGDFGDSSIELRVMLRVHEYRDQYLIRHEFIKRLHARFRREGIEIPFPIRTVHLRRDGGGADRAIPAEPV